MFPPKVSTNDLVAVCMPVKVLFLHGYGGNETLGQHMFEGLRSVLPEDAVVDVLEGHRKLYDEKHMPQLQGDAGSRLKESALQKKHDALCYGYVECPPSDPKDPTATLNADGVAWAKMSKGNMQQAVEFVSGHMEW